MHILLGALTSIVTILWLLHRLAEMGIDLGGLNPWSWRRRRAWRIKYEGDPIFAVEDPMDVASLFIVGTAKLDGDICAEEKTAILSEFANGFSLDEKAASQLYASATHLLGGPQVIGNQLEGLMERHKQSFTADQAESFLAMARRVLEASPTTTAEQRALLAQLEQHFSVPVAEDSTWAKGH